jgi:hypothetical protein
MHATPIDIRRRAEWLGYLGLLPLAAATLLLALRPGSDTSVLLAIQGYGAVILAFVGAIHWGRALDTGDGRLMTLSVIPSLLGWSCLLLPPTLGLPLLAAVFALVLLFDRREYRAVPWFRQLRLRLTFMICGLLLLSWALL